MQANSDLRDILLDHAKVLEYAMAILEMQTELTQYGIKHGENKRYVRSLERLDIIINQNSNL